MSDSNGVQTIIPAPEDYVVNFDNPKTQFVVQSYTIAAVEISLAFLFLAQRLYTKIAIMKQFQLEDCKFSFAASPINHALTETHRYRYCRFCTLCRHSSLFAPRDDAWSNRTPCLGDQCRKIHLLLKSRFSRKN